MMESNPLGAALVHMFAAFQSAESRYQQWVAEHYRFLLRSAWALTGSRAIAEDVEQDCFAWLGATASSCSIQLWREPGCFRSCGARCSAYRSPDHLLPLHESEEAASVAAPCEGLDLKLDVLKAMGRLAPNHREVLVLYYFDDLPTQQMAEALEIAPATVLSRLAAPAMPCGPCWSHRRPAVRRCQHRSSSTLAH